jgi:serine/threonine-protein kinase
VSKVLSACLAADPDDRPGSARVLAHKLMAAVPDGRAIAERVAPDLTLRSGPRDPTMQRGAWSTGSQAAVSSVPTPSSASGAEARPSRARSTLQMGRRRPTFRVAALFVVLGVALGVMAMVVATRADRAAPRVTPAAAVEAVREAARHPQSPPAARAETPDAGPSRLATAAAPAAKLAESAAERTRRPAPVKSGTLVIKVDPFAEVWIDGKQLGSTPLTHELAVGHYRVELRGPVGKRETVRVGIRAGRTARITRTWRTP